MSTGLMGGQNMLFPNWDARPSMYTFDCFCLFPFLDGLDLVPLFQLRRILILSNIINLVSNIATGDVP